MIAGVLAGFEPCVPCAPCVLLVLQRAIDRSCIIVTTAMFRSAGRFPPPNHVSRPFPLLRNNGCKTTPSRRLQDRLLDLFTLFVYPTYSTAFPFLPSFLPSSSSPHAHTFSPLHPEKEKSPHPDLSTLWLLESMAKLRYTASNMSQNITSKWKMTLMFWNLPNESTAEAAKTC